MSNLKLGGYMQIESAPTYDSRLQFAISAAAHDLADRMPLLGGLLFNCRRVVTDNITSFAGVNATSEGMTLYIHPRFADLDRMSAFKVICHEMIHLLLLHPARIKYWDYTASDKSIRYAVKNISLDLVVNQVLKEAGMEPVLHIKSADGNKCKLSMIDISVLNKAGFNLEPNMQAEYYFAKFMNNSDKQTYFDKEGNEWIFLRPKSPGDSKSNSSSTSPGPSGNSKSAESPGDSKHTECSQVSTSAGSSGPSRESQSTESPKSHGDRPRGIGFMVDRHKTWDSDCSESELEAQVKSAVAKSMSKFKGGYDKGDIPAALKRIIDELMKPKHPSWVQLVKRLIAKTVEEGEEDGYTYRRPSRYKIGDYIMPGKTAMRGGSLGIALDTSGSVSDDELRDALSHVTSLPDIGTVHVVSCDADAYDVVSIDAYRLSTKSGIDEVLKAVKGGGGTELDPAIKKLYNHARPSVLVYFTDGIANKPRCKEAYTDDMAVVWVLTKREIPKWIRGHRNWYHVMMESAKEQQGGKNG